MRAERRRQFHHVARQFVTSPAFEPFKPQPPAQPPSGPSPGSPAPAQQVRGESQSRIFVARASQPASSAPILVPARPGPSPGRQACIASHSRAAGGGGGGGAAEGGRTGGAAASA